MTDIILFKITIAVLAILNIFATIKVASKAEEKSNTGWLDWLILSAFTSIFLMALASIFCHKYYNLKQNCKECPEYEKIEAYRLKDK